MWSIYRAKIHTQIYIFFISVERNIELLKLIHTDLRENFKSWIK